MKFLLFTALLIIAGCSKLPVEPEVDGYPEIRFQTITTSEYGVDQYTFHLLKDGDENSLYYSGYSTSSPVYKLLVKENAGWKEINYGWCGTGLENISLNDLPNVSAISISTHETSQPWKLGIEFFKKVNGEIDWQNGVTIWSDIVPAK